MNDSWYRASVPAVPPRAQLQGVLDADVCIVGAGFTGLSAALELAEVAFLVGFSEPGSLARAFRRWTGQSPGEYRRHLCA